LPRLEPKDLFDQENRITGAAGYTYTYDADGNRVEKSSGGTGTLYWYMSPGIVAESDLTGALKSEYVFPRLGTGFRLRARTPA